MHCKVYIFNFIVCTIVPVGDVTFSFFGQSSLSSIPYFPFFEGMGRLTGKVGGKIKIESKRIKIRTEKGSLSYSLPPYKPIGSKLPRQEPVPMTLVCEANP